MPEISAGILFYRRAGAGPEVLLIHPGGPFWASKDAGAWSIPKGLVDPEEDIEAAARREFGEETGFPADGPLVPLGTFRQPSGKRLAAFALAGDADPAALASNSFEIEWPPRSGHMQSVPEADRAGWFAPPEARAKLLKGQVPVLEALLDLLGGPRR
jgi:predicted NUDIX family NTP pyrophosphohydrolase